MSSAQAARQRYWKKTILWVASLLIIWFLCSLGCGVLWADALDASGKAFGGGMGWGFWFAQQGSILIFLGLLTVFVVVMNRLDKQLAAEIEAGKDADQKGDK